MTGWDQIESELNEIKEFIGPLVKPPESDDSLLWHYTGTQGLEGIVSNRTIRLSHVGFLNDPSELQYANSICDEMLAKLADQDDIAQEFVRGYQTYKKDNDFRAPFVASFCSERDNLDLWRLYGDDGWGFSLGFRMQELQEVIKRLPEAKVWEIYVLRVLYDENEQKAHIDEVLNKFLGEFKKIHEVGESDVFKSQYKEVVYSSLSLILYLSITSLKHPSYENEQENRLVLKGIHKVDDNMKFLARRGYFKPYIDLKIGEDKAFPLDTVVVGPASHHLWNERSMPWHKRSIEMFLSNHLKNHNIKIESSALPYLGSGPS